MAGFTGWWWYIVGLQAPGWVGISPFLTIVGVVIIVIGVCLLTTSFKLKVKQVKPITE